MAKNQNLQLQVDHLFSGYVDDMIRYTVRTDLLTQALVSHKNTEAYQIFPNIYIG